MAGKLHHMAVNAANFEETVKFFQELFDMEVLKTNGEAPHRKLWFKQGIQVNEVSEAGAAGNVYDHIGIWVDDRERTLAKAHAMGCRAMDGKPAHWFLTPEGIVIELMV